MDTDEDEREYRRRRRRSVRNLRRQSGALPAFNLAAEDDASATDKGEQVDQPSTEAAVYGSMWMESNQPSKKRKKRRSSMFFGVAGHRLSPLKDDENTAAAGESATDARPVDCGTGSNIKCNDGQTEGDYGCQMADRVRERVGGSPNLVTDHSNRQETELGNLENMSSVDTVNNLELCSISNQTNIPTNTITKCTIEEPELYISESNVSLNSLKGTSLSAVDEEHSFTSEASVSTTPRNQSDVSLSQTSPCSMSPDYPMSPVDLYDHLPYCESHVTDNCRTGTTALTESDTVTPVANCQKSSADSFNESSDKENSLLNEGQLNMSTEKREGDLNINTETNDSKSSPGFLTMCKSFAGKVVEFVKTSPSLLVAMPLVDFNSQSNTCASPMFVQEKTVDGLTVSGDNRLSDKSAKIANYSGIDAALDQIEAETFGSYKASNCHDTSLDNVNTGVNDETVKVVPDKSSGEECKVAEKSTPSSRQDWSSFQKTFDTMMSILQQNNLKTKGSKSGSETEDVSPAEKNSTDVSNSIRPSSSEDGKDSCANAKDVVRNSFKVEKKLHTNSEIMKSDGVVSNEQMAVNVTVNLSSPHKPVSPEIEGMLHDCELDFTTVPESSRCSSKILKIKRRAFGVVDDDSVALETVSEENIHDTKRVPENIKQTHLGRSSIQNRNCTKSDATNLEKDGIFKSLNVENNKLKSRKQGSFSLKEMSSVTEMKSQGNSELKDCEIKNIVKDVNTNATVKTDTLKGKSRKRRSIKLTELPCVMEDQADTGTLQPAISHRTGSVDFEMKQGHGNCLGKELPKTKPRKRRSLKSDEVPSAIVSNNVTSKDMSVKMANTAMKKPGRPKKVSVNGSAGGAETQGSHGAQHGASGKVKYKRKSTSLIKVTVLNGQKDSSGGLSRGSGCVNEITDDISQVKLSDEANDETVHTGVDVSKRPSATRVRQTQNSKVGSNLKKVPASQSATSVIAPGEQVEKTSMCIRKSDNMSGTLADTADNVDGQQDSNGHVSQLTDEISQLRCQDSALLEELSASLDIDDVVVQVNTEEQKQRRQRRRSADSATLKIQMMMIETQSPEPVSSPVTSRLAKKRKVVNSTSFEDLEKLYRNKNYVKPEEKKPWLTIYESPQNDAMFGKKRQLRLLEENPSQMRLRRRVQKAAKNGWDPKKRRKQKLDDIFVHRKLDAMYAELDSDTETLESKLRGIVETT